MARGNFSNGGNDTFDPRKQYVGIRLQQGVPLLDRDWNELDDQRRYYARKLRREYIGQGVPDVESFRVEPPPRRAPGDFVIREGHLLVDGHDLWNPSSLFFSAQAGVDPLPAAAANETWTVYVLPAIERVDGDGDPDLLNRQDVNLETCLRDRLSWRVGAVLAPEPPPPGAYRLATIERPAGSRDITAAMIRDQRRTVLNLATAVDAVESLRGEVGNLAERAARVEAELERVKRQLARLFWDLRVNAPPRSAVFGGKVALSVEVKDGLGEAVFGAHVAFSTDWGVLEPTSAVTNRNGVATVELLLVQADTPPTRGEMGRFQRIVEKVERATLPNPGSIDYSKVRFEPDEMALLSRYSPPSAFQDLTYELPKVVAPFEPARRSVHVTMHATESGGGVVRGVGSLQISVGHWVRPWLQTKIVESASKVAVGSRVGYVMGRAIAGQAFNHKQVVDALPSLLEEIRDDAYGALGVHLYSKAEVDPEEVRTSGSLAHRVIEEVTAMVGASAQKELGSQLDQLGRDANLQFDRKGAARDLQGETAKTFAGYQQGAKQGAFLGKRNVGVR